MAIGEDDVGIGMDFAVLQPRHPMVHAAGQFADFRMQRAAEGDVHLLQAAADPEQRHAAGDTGFRQRQRQIVTLDVVGFVPGIRFSAETGRVHIGAGAGQHHAVDRIEQSADIGDIGAAREHQRQRARNLGHGAEISLSDHLGRKSIFDAVGVSDHADHRPSHRLQSRSHLATFRTGSCLPSAGGSTG